MQGRESDDLHDPQRATYLLRVGRELLQRGWTLDIADRAGITVRALLETFQREVEEEISEQDDDFMCTYDDFEVGYGQRPPKRKRSPQEVQRLRGKHSRNRMLPLLRAIKDLQGKSVAAVARAMVQQRQQQVAAGQVPRIVRCMAPDPTVRRTDLLSPAKVSPST